MRITVRRVLELLATYPDRASLFAEYAFLEPEDLLSGLRKLGVLALIRERIFLNVGRGEFVGCQVVQFESQVV
jgi:hypothetical protein